MAQMLTICFAFLAIILTTDCAEASTLAGTTGTVGCLANPTTARRLDITKPGVYENYRIDAQGGTGNIVKITANDVTLRNCEIFNGAGNGIGIFGTRVVIENCRIHHLISGTFAAPQDVHGVTGRWGDVTIRNCDISMVSGDSIQFDPDRASSGTVTVEKCHLWTGPLTVDTFGFKAGQRPGENAIDTKAAGNVSRCRLFVRNCYMHGWKQPAQINNAAALNLKENINADVTYCVFNDCEIAIRARGPGVNGGARVRVYDSAIYNTKFGIRAEDKIAILKLTRLAFGGGVGTKIRFVNGGPTSGYQNIDERIAPPMNTLLTQ